MKVAQRHGTARISGTSCTRTEAAVQRSHDYIDIIFPRELLKSIDSHDVVKVLHITIVALVGDRVFGDCFEEKLSRAFCTSVRISP